LESETSDTELCSSQGKLFPLNIFPSSFINSCFSYNFLSIVLDVLKEGDVAKLSDSIAVNNSTNDVSICTIESSLNKTGEKSNV
jgi:hypothetical protein